MSSQIKRQETSWMIEKAGFREILTFVNNGSLALIESTELCLNGGFYNAIEKTDGHLSDMSIFDAMIDVRKARTDSHPVTPLPIIFGEDR